MHKLLAVQGLTGRGWKIDGWYGSFQHIADIRAICFARLDIRRPPFERVAPHDSAILVRMRANNLEDELAPVLRENGLTLQNLARNVGEIAIQDLLAEPLTEVLLPLLRLGATGRDPDAWNVTQQCLQTLGGNSPEDEVAQERVQRQIREFTRNLRQTMRDEPPDLAVANRVFAQALDFAGVERLRQAYPEYRRDADFERVRDGFQVLVRECVENAADRSGILDRFEGKE